MDEEGLWGSPCVHTHEPWREARGPLPALADEELGAPRVEGTYLSYGAQAGRCPPLLAPDGPTQP